MRTSNLKGRYLSTARCIESLETHGVQTSQGLVHASQCLLRHLCQNRGEAGEHFFHDRLGNGFKACPVSGGEIEGARLVATDHADRLRPRAI